jgi:hypothetical protein
MAGITPGIAERHERRDPGGVPAVPVDDAELVARTIMSRSPGP